MCLNENLEVNSYKGNNLLNKRLELISAGTETNIRYDGMIARTSSKVFHVRIFYYLFILYLSSDTNIKSKCLQEELKGKSNFVQ